MNHAAAMRAADALLMDLLMAAMLGERRIDIPFKPEELRAQCSREGHAEGGKHKHHCAACDVTWKHDDALPFVCSPEQFDEAHSCPQCGARVTTKDGV